MKSERVARSAGWSGREDLAYSPAASAGTGGAYPLGPK